MEEFFSGSMIRREIESLHQFFEDWFCGRIPNDITRFETVMAPEFRLIPPSGDVLNREQILKLVADGYNTQKDRRIWTEDVVTKRLGDLILATYFELQELDGEQTRRISTAVFSYDPELPCKSMWHHVHETWK